MTIEDADDQATVMLMGRQAEQLFGSVCQDLVNKRIYPTQQTLPEEIKKTIGQNHLFQIKVNPDNKLIVTGIFPDVQAFLPSTQEDPANTTPDHPLSERKRTIETSKNALFISEPEKKTKRELQQATTTSSSVEKGEYHMQKSD